MQINGEKSVSMERDRLWGILFEVNTLSQTIPGVKELERDGDAYLGVMERSLAGISIELDAEVALVEQNPPERVTCTIEGTDNRINSRVDGTATIDLLETNEGTTLEYVMDLNFSGRLASLGSRIIKRKVNNDLQMFFTNLEAYVDECRASQ